MTRDRFTYHERALWSTWSQILRRLMSVTFVVIFAAQQHRDARAATIFNLSSLYLSKSMFTNQNYPTSKLQSASRTPRASQPTPRKRRQFLVCLLMVPCSTPRTFDPCDVHLDLAHWPRSSTPQRGWKEVKLFTNPRPDFDMPSFRQAAVHATS